ncbi:hypothetical protein RD110_07165 [Rhodoferax koreense]|uniref:Uncharacterized protein n=1 Tax=Rhodoferax koreensis TaxID=1842727 RepID=A0A1P8JTC9_9BURK|nr:hypothetical protein [Rhodoferax koreense]APW37007.1 hypothetical protein RD110_07165 [Rhodoferax koreense]
MPATPDRIQTATALRDLVAARPTPRACQCALGTCAAWESITEERWPGAQLEAVATLRDPDLDEPTFEERHPHGTRYESPDAPITLTFFPFNRCDVWHCRVCDKHLLRYTEFGGYYVDHRVRTLDPGLIED